MGYTTEFSGALRVTPVLRREHAQYLRTFAQTRRVARHEALVSLLADADREAVALPIGLQGAYFVGAKGFAGQDRGHPSIIDYNQPPSGQPGLWCQWIPSADGALLEWDQNEKFYFYVEWLQYLIEQFLGPWGYSLNGEVRWTGEEPGDEGTIAVVNSQINVLTDGEAG